MNTKAFQNYQKEVNYEQAGVNTNELFFRFFAESADKTCRKTTSVAFFVCSFFDILSIKSSLLWMGGRNGRFPRNVIHFDEE